MNPLITYIEWLLGKWHQNGLHSVTREDYVELERLYLAARSHGDEVTYVIEEFVEAMNAPRGDAADVRRSAALSLLRKKQADIQTQKVEAAKRANGLTTT